MIDGIWTVCRGSAAIIVGLNRLRAGQWLEQPEVTPCRRGSACCHGCSGQLSRLTCEPSEACCAVIRCVVVAVLLAAILALTDAVSRDQSCETVRNLPGGGPTRCRSVTSPGALE